MLYKLLKLDILNSNRLISRSLRGGAILTAGSFIERGMRFLRNIILARLLAPDQFGLMALVIAANGLFEVLTEMGIRWAIIQNKKGDTSEFLNVAFWFSSIRGMGLYVLGFLVAPLLSTFYQDISLIPLLRISFLAFLLNGLTNPGLFVLEKKLHFLPQVIVTHGAGLAGTAISLLLAFFYPNVWSLVVGFVLEAAFRCIGSFLVSPFKPSWKTDPNAKKETYQFSRGIFGLPILTYIFMQADVFILGKFCNQEVLGMYSMAFALASMPQVIFSKIAGRLILPVFSLMQEKQERLAGNLLRIIRILFLFGLPVTIVLSIFSRPIIEITYGAKYTVIAGAYSFLCLYSFLYTTNSVITNAYLAVGRPELQRLFTIVRLIILVIGLFPAVYYFQATGAAVIRVVCMMLAGLVQFHNFSVLLNITKRNYINSIKDGLILGVFISIPSLIIRCRVQRDIAMIICAGVLCGIIVLFGVWMLKNSIHKFYLGKEKSEVL